MNGDVNGMASPDQTKIVPNNCDNNKQECENGTNTEDCDIIENNSMNGSKDNGKEDIADQYVGHPVDESSIDDANKQSLEMPVTESTDNIVTKTSCENGNQFESEVTNSSQINCKISDLQETDQTNNEINDQCSIKKNGDVNEIDQNSINEDDAEDDSMAEEGSAISAEAKAEDTVSINSDSDSVEHDDETSQESQSKHNICDTIVLDSKKRPGGNVSEVHEIDSDYENDDCVIASEEKDANELKEKVPLRRSSRAVKRKRYTDDAENGDESDIEEVEPVDSLVCKNKPILITDTRALVAMAIKHMKVDHAKKKEPTVVIIDNNSSLNKINSMQSSRNSATTNNAINPQSLYQSIIARGTTVTPVSSKNNNTSTMISQNPQSTQVPQPVILPSLTDDMFVVEAPSFIVPYVYEKPAVTAFREFVDKLGKQLEEEKFKEEMIEKEKREKEKQVKKEKGEDIESDDSENIKSLDKPEERDDEEANKRRESKKEKKRRNEEDDASWDGESATESEDEILSDVDDKIVVKDKVEAIDQIKVVADLTADKICSIKHQGKSSMDCSLGKFFINIGLNLVQEYVQSDLLKQQNRKLYKEKKAGHSTKSTESSIAQLMKNLELSKENNAPYSFTQIKCEFCTFKTESRLIMAQHLETPHMKNNVYKCNFCTFEIRSPHEILYHTESVHNVRSKLEKAPSLHQCTNCQFEDNGKGKLARHLITCAKKFKPGSNLAPPIDWEPPAKIPKLSRPRNSIMSPYQNAFNRSPVPAVRGPVNVGSLAGGIPVYRPRGRSPINAPQRAPIHGVPIMRGPSMMRQNNPAALNMPNNYQINNSKPKSSHQPSISITPLPRQPAPNQATQPTTVGNHKNSFVICEICDGYIKDLEQLRNHMQWIHKVKIHPKMIYNRPPLNCQKCQFRFFTDQGFERHLLGSHGLVTSSMQEAANKGKDAGRCPVCGRVYQWKLLNHVARDHNMTLKPGHLSYKCTVCTATFGMYKQFESHVYSAHSVVAKRVMDKNKAASQSAKANDTVKPLKINEEITIIPQPVKPTATKPAKDE